MFSYTFLDLYVLKNLNVDVGFTYDLLLWAYMVNFLYLFSRFKTKDLCFMYVVTKAKYWISHVLNFLVCSNDAWDHHAREIGICFRDLCSYSWRLHKIPIVWWKKSHTRILTPPVLAYPRLQRGDLRSYGNLWYSCW